MNKEFYDAYIRDNPDVPELRIYTKLNEKQVKKIFEPQEGLFICESLRVIKRAIEAGYEPYSFFVEEGLEDKVYALTKNGNIPVYTAPYVVMKNITGYSLTGGILSAMHRKPCRDICDFLSSHQKVVVLDDIENPTNIGAVFRSAAALGADGIVLTPGCADPLYRRASRVSMGTVFQIEWTYADGSITAQLKAAGYETYAFALSENSVPVDKCCHPQNNNRIAVIMGNEDHGISDEILSESDHVVMIPMSKGVDSLNVAAASTIAFWEMFKGTDR